MRTISFRILIAIVTFAIGVSSVFLRHLIGRCSREITSIASPSKPPRTYGRGLSGSATNGSFITLNSSDGMNFTKWSVYCGSPERAERELAKRIEGGKIVTREVVFGEGGRRIGEKVVARFAPNERDSRAAALIWTENEELFEVDTSSVQYIFEYRKDFNR